MRDLDLIEIRWCNLPAKNYKTVYAAIEEVAGMIIDHYATTIGSWRYFLTQYGFIEHHVLIKLKVVETILSLNPTSKEFVLISGHGNVPITVRPVPDFNDVDFSDVSTIRKSLVEITPAQWLVIRTIQNTCDYEWAQGIRRSLELQIPIMTGYLAETFLEMWPSEFEETDTDETYEFLQVLWDSLESAN